MYILLVSKNHKIDFYNPWIKNNVKFYRRNKAALK